MDSTHRRRLVAVLIALAVAQVLHLLDELRTADDSFLTIAASPQAVLGIGGAIAAAIAVRAGHRLGRPLAIATGALVGIGFVLGHGVPVATERTEPYWGEGSADALQWFGVTVILVLCVVSVVHGRALAKRRPIPGYRAVPAK